MGGRRMGTTRRRSVSGACFASVLLLAAACGNDDEAGDDATATTAGGSETTAAESTSTTEAEAEPCGDGDVLVGYSTPIPQPAFEIISGQIEQGATDAGYSFTAAIANLDPNKQVADIDSMVQQGADVIVVAPVDENAVAPALQRAEEAGVIIVGHDVKGEGGPYITSVGTSAADASRESATYLQDLVGDGPVAVIEGPTFAAALVERNEAFAAAAAEVGLNIVDTETNLDITPEGGRVIAERLRQEFPDLAGIWAFNDVTALGVASAIGDGFEPAVVSINADPDAVAAIEAGRITASYDLQPAVTGHALVEVINAALCGEELPERILTPAEVVDESNAADWVPHDEVAAQDVEVTFEETDGQTFVRIEE